MYTPSLRMKNNGVPILSKAEIDAIGERFVQDFQPEVLTSLSPVDIEGYAEAFGGSAGTILQGQAQSSYIPCDTDR